MTILEAGFGRIPDTALPGFDLKPLDYTIFGDNHAWDDMRIVSEFMPGLTMGGFFSGARQEDEILP